MTFGVRELLIILLIVLVLFGGRKLPELARALGRAVRIFRSESEKSHEEDPDAARAEGGAEDLDA
jgi:sec-independent protein translocase protein TatA